MDACPAHVVSVPIHKFVTQFRSYSFNVLTDSSPMSQRLMNQNFSDSFDTPPRGGSDSQDSAMSAEKGPVQLKHSVNDLDDSTLLAPGAGERGHDEDENSPKFMAGGPQLWKWLGRQAGKPEMEFKKSIYFTSPKDSGWIQRRRSGRSGGRAEQEWRNQSECRPGPGQSATPRRPSARRRLPTSASPTFTFS